MSIYEGRLFNINKKLLSCIGLWPYAGASKIILRVLVQSALIGSTIPHLISVIVHKDDVDRLMLSILACLTLLTMILKMLGLMLAEKSMKQLFNELTNNWQIINDSEEKKILTRYAEIGKLITIPYIACMFVVGTAMSFLPLSPKILDRLFPLNQPRPNIYLLQGEFFVDRKDRYVFIFLCDVVTAMSCALVTMVGDSCYMAVVQQSCALYAIVSRRLRKLRPTGSDISADNTEECNSYDWLVNTMKLHRTALDFTEIVNAAYSISFFCIFLVNIILIPLVACAILANLRSPVIYGPYMLLLSSLLIHLFMINYFGQRIVHHGIDVNESAYSNEWYATPMRTQRLLMIFMIRTSKPSILTAGGIMLINFETYAVIMRTSVSYITVLASFR